MPKPQSVYAARSRKRGFHDASATQKGWRRIDVLRAYLTPEGELVVIDLDDKLYSTTAAPVESQPEPIAQSDSYRLPPKVNPARTKPYQIRNTIKNFAKNGYTEFDGIRKLLVSQADTALAVLDAMDKHAGPDWREQLENLSDE